jgi:hypothetical protein
MNPFQTFGQPIRVAKPGCIPLIRIRFYGGEPKGLLRQAYRGILPDHILDRRKKGFGIPRYYLKDVSGGRFIQEHVLRSLYLTARTKP